MAMEIIRSPAIITLDDLRDLYHGSVKRLRQYFETGNGEKWRVLYDFEKPVAVALCQGAALHFVDKSNGVKDFDVWFFYPYNKKHLPYRTIWNWDYVNKKFGRHPDVPGYKGRIVDVMVRSIKNYTADDPVKTIHQFLESEHTASSAALAKKAVVLLAPDELVGKVVWCRKKI